jgi:predicted metalloprotease with PDZ domain
MIEFYNVKKKQKVQVDSSKVTKHTYEKTAKSGKLTIRYALKAVDEDGTKLTKFCSKAVYEEI